MSLTIGNTKVSTWKHLKAQYIAAALGVALALSTVVAVAPRHGTSVGPVAPSAESTSRAGQGPSFVYYLAASQQEANLFNAVISSEQAVLGSTNTQALAVALSDPETKSLLVEASRELMAMGIDFRVVDLNNASGDAAGNRPRPRPDSRSMPTSWPV